MIVPDGDSIANWSYFSISSSLTSPSNQTKRLASSPKPPLVSPQNNVVPSSSKEKVVMLTGPSNSNVSCSLKPSACLLLPDALFPSADLSPHPASIIVMMAIMLNRYCVFFIDCPYPFVYFLHEDNITITMHQVE